MEPRDDLLPLRGSQRAAEVRQQMERILADPFFSGANRRSRLLRFLVEQTLEDHPEAVKESVIATEVFDRPADYDPQVDSIVRVEVGRLRGRLAEYYGSVGVDDPVKIEIPRGGYRPTFAFRDASVSTAVAGADLSEPQNAQVPIGPGLIKAGRPVRTSVLAAFAVVVIAGAALTSWVVFRTRASRVPAASATIAVLPFLNLTGNAADDYIGDSLTEEITGALAEFSELRVVSRTSAFQFKGKSVDAREIGRNLNASAVLEGSIARRGARLHVVAQLVRTSDGIHLWSRAYDAEAGELAPVEATIAEEARATLSPSLKPHRPAEVSESRNPEAHDLYMRAIYQLNLRTEESVRQSISLARQAAAADPAFAQPWVVMAAGESQLNTFLAQAPHAGAERAWEDLSKALELNPGNSAAHAHRALLAYTDHWDWPQAEREFQLALREGSHGSVESLYGWCLITRGRFKEARTRLQSAAELDPLSLGPQLNQLSELMAERNWLEVQRKAEQLLSISPRNASALTLATSAAFWQKDCPNATAMSQRFLDAYPLSASARLAKMGAKVICGHRSEAEADLAALISERPAGYVSPYSLAAAWAVDGNADAAMLQLEKSAEYREPVLMLLKVDQAFDSLRQDSRLMALERRLGLLD